MTGIRLYHGDITGLAVDAVVNAANEQLIGGGGVDGAIHSAAGPGLLEASRKLAPCPAGNARLTPGFGLRASFVIHAVGPVYIDGYAGEPETLANTYQAALRIAESEALETIAFPCISTGAFRYPPKEAAKIAIRTCINWQQESDLPAIIVFCCFEQHDYQLYAEYLDELGILKYFNG